MEYGIDAKEISTLNYWFGIDEIEFSSLNFKLTAEFRIFVCNYPFLFYLLSRLIRHVPLFFFKKYILSWEERFKGIGIPKIYII
jgi:hypothetical protein